MSSESALRAIIEERDEEIRQLKETIADFLAPPPFPLQWDLTSQQTAILAILMRRIAATPAEKIIQLLGSDCGRRNVYVQLFHMRRKLLRYGIEIRSSNSRDGSNGYWLAPASRALVQTASSPK